MKATTSGLTAKGVLNMDVNDIIPYENNPRINDKAVDAVANSIKEFGFKVPIIVDRNNVIIAGHTRLKAALKLGMTDVPVIIADDLTPDQVNAFRLADNKVGELAEWDFNALEAELANIDLDMSQFTFDVEPISPDDFGDDFSLPDGDKNEICQMTFTLHTQQAEAIKDAISKVGEVAETFGNTNSNGNKLYEVVRQWEELRTSL